MDPNAALEAIRTARAELFSEGEPYDPEVVRTLIEQIDALDSWLSREGFLPGAWAIPGERG
jgi:hypothetical protein